MKNGKPQQQTHVETEAVRRRLSDQLRKLAAGKRFTPAERAEYARIAELWEKTLPTRVSN